MRKIVLTFNLRVNIDSFDKFLLSLKLFLEGRNHNRQYSFVNTIKLALGQRFCCIFDGYFSRFNCMEGVHSKNVMITQNLCLCFLFFFIICWFSSYELKLNLALFDKVNIFGFLLNANYFDIAGELYWFDKLTEFMKHNVRKIFKKCDLFHKRYQLLCFLEKSLLKEFNKDLIRDFPHQRFFINHELILPV